MPQMSLSERIARRIIAQNPIGQTFNVYDYDDRTRCPVRAWINQNSHKLGMTLIHCGNFAWMLSDDPDMIIRDGYRFLGHSLRQMRSASSKAELAYSLKPCRTTIAFKKECTDILFILEHSEAAGSDF